MESNDSKSEPSCQIKNTSTKTWCFLPSCPCVNMINPLKMCFYSSRPQPCRRLMVLLVFLDSDLKCWSWMCTQSSWGLQWGWAKVRGVSLVTWLHLFRAVISNWLLCFLNTVGFYCILFLISTVVKLFRKCKFICLLKCRHWLENVNLSKNYLPYCYCYLFTFFT